MNISELVEIMSSNGVVTLADIARELGVSPQSVSNWKARDRVPYKYVVEVQKRYQPSQDGDSEGGDRKSESKGSGAQQVHTAPVPPFLLEEEKKFSLAEFLMPVAQNLRFIVRSTIIMALVGVAIFLGSSLIALLKNEEPERVYVTTAKLVIPGGLAETAGEAASGILGQLRISVPSPGGPAPTSTLASPSLYPEFLGSRSFAKRLFTRSFDTKKYGEQTLLEIVIREHEEELNEPGLFDWLFSPEPIAIDRSQGLDTLVMEYMGVLSSTDPKNPGMIEFAQAGSFQTLTVRAMEPELSVDIAYVVLDELQEFTKYFKSKDLERSREYIEDRIKVVGSELEALEERMKEFRERNRQISSPALQLQEDRISRNLSVYKGIYLTLNQELEKVKIEQQQEINSIIQILDYPIAPLGPTTIAASTSQNPVIVILMALVGLGFGLVVSLAKGYFSTVDEDERTGLSKVGAELRSNLRAITSFRSRRN